MAMGTIRFPHGFRPTVLIINHAGGFDNRISKLHCCLFASAWKREQGDERDRESNSNELYLCKMFFFVFRIGSNSIFLREEGSNSAKLTTIPSSGQLFKPSANTCYYWTTWAVKSFDMATNLVGPLKISAIGHASQHSTYKLKYFTLIKRCHLAISLLLETNAILKYRTCSAA